MAAGVRGDLHRALAESETALRLAPEHAGALGLRGSVLFFSDRIEEGVALWQSAAEKSYVTPFSHALVCIGLGEFDTAFEWLDRAVDERDVHILHLTVKPVYDPIRTDPRFHALLRKMRLEP